LQDWLWHILSTVSKKDAFRAPPCHFIPGKTRDFIDKKNGSEDTVSLSKRLNTGMKRPADAETLAASTAFYPYSQAVVETVEAYGSNDHTSWFVHFCPMAFGNTGATWLGNVACAVGRD
jgi:hypothetical protein